MSDLLTIEEVAQKLRVNDTTVRRWAKSGAIKREDIVVLPHSSKRMIYRVRRRALEALGVAQHCP